jgi:tRNA pseudouridine38-40 synthase
MRRIAVKVAYLGEGFSGSQIQPGLRTVMGQILSDLVKTGGGHDEAWFDLKMASRTDAGVNALGNVAVFNTEFDDGGKLLKALNAVTDGLYYRAVAFVDDKFNPRLADDRTYTYVLPSKGIDTEKARACMELFLGDHDFVRFCKVYDKPTRMTIESIEMVENEDSIVMTFRSRYFLWNQVRKIVAAVAAVGSGKAQIESVRNALDGLDVSFGLARPDALTLTDVEFKDTSFLVPDCWIYGGRVKEEKFRNSVRTAFFSALE